MKNTKPHSAPAPQPSARQAPTHSIGAIHAAEIITGGDYDSPKRYKTAYGLKTCQGVADIIDRETHAPELLEALQRAVEYLDAHRPKGNIRDIFHELNQHENGVMKPARAALARATGGTA